MRIKSQERNPKVSKSVDPAEAPRGPAWRGTQASAASGITVPGSTEVGSCAMGERGLIGRDWGGRYAGVDSARANGDFLVPFGSAGEGAGELWSSILWRRTKAGCGRGEFPGPRVGCSMLHNQAQY